MKIGAAGQDLGFGVFWGLGEFWGWAVGPGLGVWVWFEFRARGLHSFPSGELPNPKLESCAKYCRSWVSGL